MNSSQRQSGGREIQLAPDDLIITKTDPSGHISYANRTFMRIAGYAEHELLGKPHNLIRHPDMPRGVYRLLWQTLRAGQEFFGLVKNYTAQGDYYWVFANITPDYTAQRTLAGYYSVRRQPTRAGIAAVSPLYQQMCAIEAQAGKAAAPDASMQWLLAQLAEKQVSYQQFVLALEQAGAAT